MNRKERQASDVKSSVLSIITAFVREESIIISSGDRKSRNKDGSKVNSKVIPPVI